ncbi:MAG: 30S ribosomal protein S20 [Candidatus Paceibacterota bacterium]|jgi:small subunit ribosomal protein S20
MAITASAKKAIRNSKRKHEVNLKHKKSVTDVRKDIEKLVAKKDLKAAVALLPKAYQAIDKSMKLGLLKKNTAARRKSRLARLVSAK